VAHLYNAKLDFAMARRQNTGLIDPTADAHSSSARSGATTPKSGSVDVQMTDAGPTVVTTDVMLPLAPGTTLVRYFVGLLNPEQPYNNPDEHIFRTGARNTYVLYRAQFSPYNADGSVNTDLFAIGTDGKPTLDDPDFFRVVKDSDICWFDRAHGNYKSQGPSTWTTTAHNDRLKNWEQIARPVLTAPETDLLILPHNDDRSLRYDPTGGAFPGVAHYGGDRDPVTGTAFPVVHAAVQFRPGIVESDAAPVTNTDYSGAGVPSNSGNETGLPYIPTQYATSGQNWTDPFTVSLYPIYSGGAGPDPSKPYYMISQSGVTPPPYTFTATPVQVVATDLVEYLVDPANGAPQPVYDVSQGTPIIPKGRFVPLAVNSDSGIINTDVQALPDTFYSLNNVNTSNPHPFVKFWYYRPGATSHTVDLTQPMTDESRNVYSTAAVNSPLGVVANARIVPGSLQVYGPDMTSGPSNYASVTANYTTAYPNIPNGWVLYSPIGLNGTPGANQYQIDYNTGMIMVAADYPTDTVTSPNGAGATAGLPLFIAYDYQSNLSALSDDGVSVPAAVISAANPANPFVAKVEYHSKDLINVSIGVRFFNAEGNAQTVSATNDLKVGNGTR